MSAPWMRSWRHRQEPSPGPRRAGARRRGMSLLEVMLSTAMLLASVMMLSRMAFLARKHAEGAEDRSTSQRYCQNVMEEMLAGVRPLQSVSPTLLEGDVWIYKIGRAHV